MSHNPMHVSMLRGRFQSSALPRNPDVEQILKSGVMNGRRDPTWTTANGYDIRERMDAGAAPQPSKHGDHLFFSLLLANRN